MTDDVQVQDDDDLDEVEIIEDFDAEDTGGSLRGPEFASGVLVGALLGGLVALLLAPQTGSRTRKDIGRRVRRIRRDAEGRWHDARGDLERRVKRRKRKIKGQVKKAAKRTRQAVERLT